MSSFTPISTSMDCILSISMKAEEIDKPKDLSEFDKGQIVMAIRLGQSTSEIADLVGCSESTVQEIMDQTASDKGSVSTKEKAGAEKRSRKKMKKNT